MTKISAAGFKKKFFDFFVKKNHAIIPSASLIPEGDSSTLFISAGMHPLVPYLLGEPHPLGRRLCSVQKCLRTGDIEAVGDNCHHTFFEMLGNWSLGDYWKEEAISWSFEFLTKELGMDSEKLLVTCFAGDSDAPRDEQSANVWKKLGLSQERIYFLGKEDNWWGPVGQSGPCGPDTEMFFDTGRKRCGPNCRPGCHCGKYVEIWNDVFMEYNRLPDGKYEPLKQKNVDTGMGVERVGIFNGIYDNYQTDLFLPIIKQIEESSEKSYEDEKNKKLMRVIADHLRAAVFLAADGVEPSNKQQGYVMRRLIRRAVVKMLQLGIVPPKEAPKICRAVVNIYQKEYSFQEDFSLIMTEIESFLRTINKGTKLLQAKETIDGKLVFDLYQTYGFPLEITTELLEEWGRSFNKEKLENEFGEELKKHQEVSRTAFGGIFRGGLVDGSEMAIKYHTATHLLHAALRKVLGNHLHQTGSNINSDRLRFDFAHPAPLTKEEIKQVEEIVNQKIKENLPVKAETMSFDESQKAGALAFFKDRYPSQVKVYSMGDFSKEVCAGPHVGLTGELGHFRIIKEESCGSNKRRIYAVLEKKD